MQARHTDRKCYFEESAQSSARYYLPYILQYHSVSNTDRILEVGCGEGGNLKPFAQKGCVVTGIDMANVRIEQAKRFFKEDGLVGNFICHDFMTFTPPVHYNDKYSIIILHDVIEHVVCKENLIKHISCLSCLVHAFRWSSTDMSQCNMVENAVFSFITHVSVSLYFRKVCTRRI